MSRKERFYIVIKWHYNPTTNEVGKRKKLPVLMMDSEGNPLEFDTLSSAEEFTEITLTISPLAVPIAETNFVVG